MLATISTTAMMKKNTSSFVFLRALSWRSKKSMILLGLQPRKHSGQRSQDAKLEQKNFNEVVGN